MKFLTSFFLFILVITKLSAQDFIIKTNDDVIRGTIKGTDYFSVFISENDNTDIILAAKDVKNFFWNGDSFVSKGFASKKDFEYRFVKVIEIGKVNLYAFGGGTLLPLPKTKKKSGFKPEISIGTGLGSGGYGGAGLGGGISLGTGNRNYEPERPAGAPVVRYFIEKPGTGPMQEIQIRAITDEDKKDLVKATLIQKMGDQPILKSKIESNTELNTRDVANWVKEYNQLMK